ncbi:MAG: dephospho-CoA kinase [Bacteroidota bacterium]
MKRNRPFLVGVTGGIGSGKSTVCKIFEVLGHLVYYADDRAKWLMNHQKELREKIISLFGPKSYEENHLNRSWIGQLVFQDPDLLRSLNELVHPAVRQDLANWLEENKEEKFLFYEAALIFETGNYKKMERTILVTAPEQVRIQRILQRDPGRTVEGVKKIMAQQMPDEEKKRLADRVIQNDGDSSLLGQTMSFYHSF